MSPLYYVAPYDTVRAHQDNFPFGSHMTWMDEDAKIVCVKIRFLEEGDHQQWMKQPGVRMLPHPIFEQDKDIDDDLLEMKNVKDKPSITQKRADVALGNAKNMAVGAKLGHGIKVHDLIRAMSHPDHPGSAPLMALTVV
jgi:hypothetical protein